MLAWRLFWREWRSGGLLVLVASLALAVAISSGMLAFTGQVKTALYGEAARFLAADRVLGSSRELPPEWAQQAAALPLQVAQFAVFPTMVFVGDASALAVVKAVSPAYPLRGELRTGMAAGEAGAVQRQGPAAGRVWLEPRLLQQLGARIGDTVSVGEIDLVIEAVLLAEPDGGNRLSMMAPRLMMALQDLPATGIVQPGSRVEYSLLLAGLEEQLQQFEAWLQPQLQAWHRWSSLREGRPAVGRALDRAGAFLLLAGALAVLLAATAAWLASRHYARSQRQAVAVLKTLGADRPRLRRLYGGLLLGVGLCAIALGCLLGWLLGQALRWLFAPLLSIQWPEAGVAAYAAGAATGAFCLLVFVWPLLWQLQRVAPDSLLRESGEQAGRDWGLLPGLLLLCALASLLSGSWRLGLLFLAAVAVVAGLLVLLLRGALAVARRFHPLPGSALFLALSSWQRRPWGTVLQAMVFALAFALVATVGVMRGSLLQDWQRQLPAGTPNHFLLNIAPHEQPAVQQFLDEHGIATAGLYPMIRGRLLQVNGHDPVPAKPQSSSDEEAGWSLDRELNLSWSASLPADNTLVAGQWWDAAARETALVSVEARIAERLGLQIGDRLRFNIGGALLEAQVSSFRQLDWETMRPNFFFLFSPGVIDNYPATWMTSFHLPPERSAQVVELGRRFPTVSVIDIGSMIAQAKAVIDQISLALQAVFGLMLAAGLLVLLAVLQAGLPTRRWEAALLKALGASPRRLRQGLWLEFALLGAVAGLLGAAAAELVVWQVATRALGMAASWHPALWWQWPLAGALLVSCIGYLRLRRALAVPPAQVLSLMASGD